MTKITLTPVKRTDGTVVLELVSPFNPILPAKLKQLGGIYIGTKKAWQVPADVESSVREICREIYGIDPMGDNVDLVDIRVPLDESESIGETLWMFGRSVLRRPRRNSSVRVGEGVSILSGGFKSSGGNLNNPAIGFPEPNTVLLIRDIPRHLAEEAQRLWQEEGKKVEILEKATPPKEFVEEAMETVTKLGRLWGLLSDEERENVGREILRILAQEKRENLINALPAGPQ